MWLYRWHREGAICYLCLRLCEASWADPGWAEAVQALRPRQYDIESSSFARNMNICCKTFNDGFTRIRCSQNELLGWTGGVSFSILLKRRNAWSLPVNNVISFAFFINFPLRQALVSCNYDVASTAMRINHRLKYFIKKISKSMMSRKSPNMKFCNFSFQNVKTQMKFLRARSQKIYHISGFSCAERKELQDNTSCKS